MFLASHIDSCFLAVYESDDYYDYDDDDYDDGYDDDDDYDDDDGRWPGPDLKLGTQVPRQLKDG